MSGKWVLFPEVWPGKDPTRVTIEEQILVMHEVNEQLPKCNGVRLIPVVIKKADLAVESREQLEQAPCLS